MRVAPTLKQQATGGGQRKIERRPHRRARRGQARRRVWAGLIGGVLGWGIAGLDGGFANTPQLPQQSVDFTAIGTYVTAELGAVPFEVATNGRLFRQVLTVEGDQLAMVFDRDRGRIVIIDSREVVILPTHGGMEGIVEPFLRAETAAEGPLEIVRDGIGSHLGLACDRYRATGTAKGGAPLQASACITADGIPMTSEITIAQSSTRTKLDHLTIGTPPPELFVIPEDREVIDLVGH